MSNSSGSSNRRGSRLAAPGRSSIVLPAGIGDAGDRRCVTLAMRNWARSGLSNRSVSSMKFGMRSRSSRSRSWMSGRSARIRSANDSSRTVVSWPPENRLAASSATSFTSGIEPSGKVAVAIAVMMSSRGARRRSSM